MELVANALPGLKTDHAFVVHGDDGMDEISISAPTKVMEIRRRRIRSSYDQPGRFRSRSGSHRKRFAAATRRTNAGIIEGILKGEQGPRRDVVLMNAAAALMVARRRRGIVDRKDSRLAADSIDSG